MHSSSDEDAIPPTATRINSINFTSQLSSDVNMNDDESKLEDEKCVNINSSIDQENESNCVEETSSIKSLGIKKEKKKKRKNKFTPNLPVEIANDKTLKKYWYKRFSLFSMFDLGIKLDRGTLKK